MCHYSILKLIEFSILSVTRNLIGLIQERKLTSGVVDGRVIFFYGI